MNQTQVKSKLQEQDELKKKSTTYERGLDQASATEMRDPLLYTSNKLQVLPMPKKPDEGNPVPSSTVRKHANRWMKGAGVGQAAGFVIGGVLGAGAGALAGAVIGHVVGGLLGLAIQSVGPRIRDGVGKWLKGRKGFFKRRKSTDNATKTGIVSYESAPTSSNAAHDDTLHTPELAPFANFVPTANPIAARFGQRKPILLGSTIRRNVGTKPTFNFSMTDRNEGVDNDEAEAPNGLANDTVDTSLDEPFNSPLTSSPSTDPHSDTEPDNALDLADNQDSDSDTHGNSSGDEQEASDTTAAVVELDEELSDSDSSSDAPEPVLFDSSSSESDSSSDAPQPVLFDSSSSDSESQNRSIVATDTDPFSQFDTDYDSDDDVLDNMPKGMTPPAAPILLQGSDIDSGDDADDVPRSRRRRRRGTPSADDSDSTQSDSAFSEVSDDELSFEDRRLSVYSSMIDLKLTLVDDDGYDADSDGEDDNFQDLDFVIERARIDLGGNTGLRDVEIKTDDRAKPIDKSLNKPDQKVEVDIDAGPPVDTTLHAPTGIPETTQDIVTGIVGDMVDTAATRGEAQLQAKKALAAVITKVGEQVDAPTSMPDVDEELAQDFVKSLAADQLLAGTESAASQADDIADPQDVLLEIVEESVVETVDSDEASSAGTVLNLDDIHLALTTDSDTDTASIAAPEDVVLEIDTTPTPTPASLGRAVQDVVNATVQDAIAASVATVQTPAAPSVFDTTDDFDDVDSTPTTRTPSPRGIAASDVVLELIEDAIESDVDTHDATDHRAQPESMTVARQLVDEIIDRSTAASPATPTTPADVPLSTNTERAMRSLVQGLVDDATEASDAARHQAIVRQAEAVAHELVDDVMEEALDLFAMQTPAPSPEVMSPSSTRSAPSTPEISPQQPAAQEREQGWWDWFFGSGDQPQQPRVHTDTNAVDPSLETIAFGLPRLPQGENTSWPPPNVQYPLHTILPRPDGTSAYARQPMTLPAPQQPDPFFNRSRFGQAMTNGNWRYPADHGVTRWNGVPYGEHAQQRFQRPTLPTNAPQYYTGTHLALQGLHLLRRTLRR